MQKRTGIKKLEMQNNYKNKMMLSDIKDSSK